nr:hypothetical protein [Tanacetum cinerariifolium]
MEAEATTTMTVKLPILNPREYDLWFMRIEQYFDYSFWEIIKNENKVMKKTDETSKETYEPTPAEEKLDIRNEMKARGTLLMALLNKDQLKFHSYQDAKLLMGAIEKRRNGSTLEMAILTIRAISFMKRTCNNLDMNGRRISFDKSKVECFNCHKNGHFARESRALKNQDNKSREYGRKTILVESPIENALIAQDEIGGYDWSYQDEEDILTNHAFMALTSLGSSSSSEFEVDSCSKSCMKAYASLKEEYDSLTLDYKKSQYNLLSYKVDSQVSDKSIAGLGYKEITPDSFVNSSERLEKQENRSDKGYHAVPPPLTGNYMPSKRDLRLIDEYFKSVYVDVVSNIAPSDVKTVKPIDVNHKGVFSTEEPKPVMKNNFSPLIKEDWHSDDEILTRSGKINTAGASVNTAARPVNTAGSKSIVNHPRIKSKAYKRGHSQDTRPNNKFSANKNSIFNKKVLCITHVRKSMICSNPTIVTTAVPTPRAKEIVFHKQKQSQIPTVSLSKDKGKAKMIEPKVPIKKKDQMRIDEEYARKLKAKEQEAARISRAQQDEEAKKSWGNMQAMMDADRLLAERLKTREREEFSKVQKARFTKRTAEHLDISKKQKVDENVKSIIDDSEDLKKCMEIILDDGDKVLIKATPISSRSLTIIDYKIHKEGKKNYFKIIRADGNSQVYQTFEKMFKNFNREDLEILWAIVKTDSRRKNQ